MCKPPRLSGSRWSVQPITPVLLLLALQATSDAASGAASAGESSGETSNADGDSTTSSGPWEYVVVGAGASGSVVAARLAEAGASVILLEAGGWDTADLYNRPHGRPYWEFTDIHDSAYAHLWQPALSVLPMHASQEAAASAPPENSKPWPRLWKDAVWQGQGLGGTMAVNGNVYFRGSVTEYEALGWSRLEVEEAFQRVEERLPRTWSGQRSKRLALQTPLQRDMATALEDVSGVTWREDSDGVPTVAGIYGGHYATLGCHDSVRSCGRKHTAYSAFVASSNRSGSRIHVRVNARVRRVLFGRGRRAVGVLLEDGLERISAARAVILCTGAFATPKILTLSGIGSLRDLRRLRRGHGVRHTNAVGRGLRNKIATSMNVTFDGLPCHVREPQMFATAMLNFTHAAKQLIAGSVDVQLSVVETCDGRQAAMQLIAKLIRPSSQGRVVVSSESNLALQAPKLLEVDVKKLVRILRMILTAIEALPSDWLPRLELSQADLAAHVRKTAELDVHWCCSVKAGVGRSSALRSDLRVAGTRSLYVADASALPSMPSGNPAGACMMLGEILGKRLLKARASTQEACDKGERICRADLGQSTSQAAAARFTSWTSTAEDQESLDRRGSWFGHETLGFSQSPVVSRRNVVPMSVVDTSFCMDFDGHVTAASLLGASGFLSPGLTGLRFQVFRPGMSAQRALIWQVVAETDELRITVQAAQSEILPEFKFAPPLRFWRQDCLGWRLDAGSSLVIPFIPASQPTGAYTRRHIGDPWSLLAQGFQFEEFLPRAHLIRFKAVPDAAFGQDVGRYDFEALKGFVIGTVSGGKEAAVGLGQSLSTTATSGADKVVLSVVSHDQQPGRSWRKQLEAFIRAGGRRILTSAGSSANPDIAMLTVSEPALAILGELRRRTATYGEVISEVRTLLREVAHPALDGLFVRGSSSSLAQKSGHELASALLDLRNWGWVRSLGWCGKPFRGLATLEASGIPMSLWMSSWQPWRQWPAVVRGCQKRGLSVLAEGPQDGQLAAALHQAPSVRSVATRLSWTSEQVLVRSLTERGVSVLLSTCSIERIRAALNASTTVLPDNATIQLSFVTAAEP